MIITISGANFRASNIGTLSTWTVSKSIGAGAEHNGIPSYVDKNSAFDYTITLKNGYTFGTYSVTMGGQTITPTVTETSMKIYIASVTGAIRIEVKTINSSTGEEDKPVTPKPEELFTYTINPIPAAARVTLSAPGYTQSANTIKVPSGTSVSWTVESLGYTKQEGIETVSQDNSKDVALVNDSEYHIVTIKKIPSDAKVTFTPSGGQKISSDDNAIVMTAGTRLYYGVSKDGYVPEGEALAASTGDKDITVELDAVPIVTVDKDLDLTTDAKYRLGYFITSSGAWNGYYSNFGFYQIPVQPGQRYKVCTVTGQNAWPVLFAPETKDWSDVDFSAQPAANTLTALKYTVTGYHKYAGPPVYGEYVVTIPDGATCMIVNNGTTAEAKSKIKVSLLK